MLHDDVQELHDLLDTTRSLMKSPNPLVQIAAERIAAILVDALYELDPTEMDNPWDLLLAMDEPK